MITMSSAMPGPMQRSLRSLIIGGLCVAAAALSACAALRFGYNQAPDLTYWWADRYVDFDEAQSLKAKAELAAWFRWHRAERLPTDATRLAAASREVLGPTTPARICALRAEAVADLPRLVDHALPALAEMALTLKPKQLQHIAARFDKVNKEFRDDHVPADRDDRLDAEVERIESRAKMLYGRLDKAQLQRLREGIAASPFDPERWYAERVARQQDLLRTLRQLHAQPATPQQAQAALRAQFDHVWQSPRPAFRAYAEQLDSAYCGVLAELHNSTSPAQRESAARKLQGWETDLRVLSGAAAS
jgi:hypothetical protein